MTDTELLDWLEKIKAGGLMSRHLFYMPQTYMCFFEEKGKTVRECIQQAIEQEGK